MLYLLPHFPPSIANVNSLKKNLHLSYPNSWIKELHQPQDGGTCSSSPFSPAPGGLDCTSQELVLFPLTYSSINPFFQKNFRSWRFLIICKMGLVRDHHQTTNAYLRYISITFLPTTSHLATFLSKCYMLVCSHISQLSVPIRIVRSRICFENAWHQTPKQFTEWKSIKFSLSVISDLPPNSQITAHHMLATLWVPSASSKISPSPHLDYLCTQQEPRKQEFSALTDKHDSFLQHYKKKMSTKSQRLSKSVGFFLGPVRLF